MSEKMKLKLVFTAEITEDIGDVQVNKIYTEEQNRAMVEGSLREICGKNAEIIIRDCKLIKVT